MQRLYAWVPKGTRIHLRDHGNVIAGKNYRVKVYQIIDGDTHDHPGHAPCDLACWQSGKVRAAWVDGDAQWCEAYVELLDERDPRWYPRVRSLRNPAELI